MNRDMRAGKLLLLPMLILIGLGWVMVFSTALPGPGKAYGDVLYLLGRQVLATGIGAACLYVAVRVPTAVVVRFSPAILAVTGAMMLVVFVPGLGKSVARATRWIDLRVFTFQPVEVFKLSVVVMYAWLLAREQSRVPWGRDVWLKVGGLALLGVLLPVLQRDFGSAVLMLVLGGVMMWLAGARTRYLFGFGVAGLAVASLLILSAPYRIHRIKTYLSAFGSPDGGGYQTKQSLIALGAGGFFGVGLGESGQKLYYLPLAHADFIYSIIGEELGFAGALATLSLYLLFLHQGFRVSRHSPARFTRLLSAGLTMLIFLEALWHIMVALALVPTKGLALPFVSYGGSSLISSMLAVGLILRCSLERNSGEQFQAGLLPLSPIGMVSSGGMRFAARE